MNEKFVLYNDRILFWLLTKRAFSTVLICASILFFINYHTFAGESKQKDVAEMNRLFNGDGILLKLKIEIPESSANSLRRDARKYVPCAVIEGDRVYSNVAIHLKGSAGSFRGFDDPKPGFTLNFAHFQPNQKFHGVRKIHLNNCAQDPTYLSEFICGYLFRAAGVPATRVAHSFVKVNNRNTQLYVVKEAFEKEFFEQYFEDPNGNAYGESGGADVDAQMHRMEGKEALDWSDLKKLAAAAREKDPNKCYELLKSNLEVERFISFMALEIMLCHWDGYTFARHNFRLYHDPSTDKITFIPHDLDQMMHDPNVPVLPGVNGMVSQAILRIPETKQRYLQRFEEIFENYFRPEDLTNRIDRIVEKLKPQIEEVDKNLAKDFENRSRDLKQRIINRAQSIKRQLDSIKPKVSPTIGEITKADRWRIVNDGNSAQMNIVKENEKTLLHIKANSKTMASFRTTARLEKGDYMFEALAKSARIRPISDGKGEGAGLRIAGSQTIRQNKLTGDAQWQKLVFQFSIDAPQEVELICELRAENGEVWFDTSSFKVYKK
ncbi:MAG: CotH kinase family protein [Verrucomicrobiia bacterium]